MLLASFSSDATPLPCLLFTWCVFQVTRSPTDEAPTLHTLFLGLGTLVWHLPLCWINWCIFSPEAWAYHYLLALFCSLLV